MAPRRNVASSAKSHVSITIYCSRQSHQPIRVCITANISTNVRVIKLMASSTFSWMNSPSSSLAITKEEFNLFHCIDRQLYSLLILNLGREPAESMQVMALWLWLERTRHDQYLVKKMLSLPIGLVNVVAEETVTCLRCIESDEFRTDPDGNDLPTLQSLIDSGICLHYFHENRLRILRGVAKVMNEVCVRAFEDMLRMTFQNNQLSIVSDSDGGSGGFGGYYRPFLTMPLVCPDTGMVDVQHIWPNVQTDIYDPYDLTIQRQVLNEELGDLLSRINMTVTEEEKEVPPDHRTVFLTFSKGYPISEAEVRDFFTGKFGDIIEAVYMQEVEVGEQALYARLVVGSVHTIDLVLNGQSKVKFSINGKHVWARKYVRRQSKSSLAVTPPSHPPA